MKFDSLIIRTLGLQAYLPCWQQMQHFTFSRNENTTDEIWLVEHPPVFTQGQNGKPEHILNPKDIPVIKIDRGGQVTYHGPGQLLAYTLIDLKRRALNIRQFINLLENAVIATLQEFGLNAHTQSKAPGVYIANQKICSLGLRVKKGAAYHGLALNISMDLTPFTHINPCGFHDLKMAQLSNWCPTTTVNEVELVLIKHLMKKFAFTHSFFSDQAYGIH